MNYRHLYHAGNFADVFKHVLLISLLESFKQKEKPFCYLDTHAGMGLYNLLSEEANQTQEFSSGVLKIPLGKRDQNLPIFIEKYIAVLAKYAFPTYYPGSPFIAGACLRSCDRMVLMELHPEDYLGLKQSFSQNAIKILPSVAIHHQDGYLGLKAFLPPKEKRGLIFIDPPFEKSNEWQCIIDNSVVGVKRFSNGTFVIWYPIKDKRTLSTFYENLKMHFREVTLAELTIHPFDAPLGLIGCGLAVINPPWQWADSIQSSLSFLWKTLSINGAGGYHVKTLFEKS